MKINKNIAISDSGFLLNPSTGESFSLNPMGVRILNMIKKELNYSEIEKEIIQEFDVSRSMFDRDYQDFIGIMKQYNLFETENTKDDGKEA